MVNNKLQLNLQQQKLLELTSPVKYNIKQIYLQQQKLLELTSLKSKDLVISRSTIVEIIRAYQPQFSVSAKYFGSTIVEIIRAYQPKKRRQSSAAGSTIVEIIRAYQPTRLQPLIMCIYNSRNYQSLLALNEPLRSSLYLQQQKLLELTSPRRFFSRYFLSTIVEIIRAYQPKQRRLEKDTIYNSRNYQSLLAT